MSTHSTNTPIAPTQPIQVAVSPAPHSEVSANPQPCVTDFMTDGSLASLVSELTRLTGVPVELRDSRGRLIKPAHGGGISWQAFDDGQGCDPSASYFPLLLGTNRIGSLVIRSGEPLLTTDARAGLHRVVELLSRASAELIGFESELKDRVRELSALHKLNAMLSRADSVDRIMSMALDSALDVLQLDAGNIVLLKEDADGILSTDEADLKHIAWRGLSSEWLRCPLPVSKDRIFDALALKGEVVTSGDLLNDTRVLIADRVRTEGLAAAMNAGLIFQNHPIGVIRLYSKVPRLFTEQEKRLLKSIAEQAAVAIEQSRLMRFQEEERRAQRQLALAADVQRRMLPRAAPTLPRLDVAAKYTPSLELGGDFYDTFEINGHLGIAIGDVSGKGVAAALLMSGVRASLRAFVQDLYDIDEVMARVNTAMCRDTHASEFATVWYGVIDPLKLRLTYCSAGHEPPLIVRVRPPLPDGTRPQIVDSDVDELGVGGMAVGVDSHQRYQRGIYDLHPGDVLVNYTDGITDARNFTGDRFGRARLRTSILRILNAEPDAGAQRLVDLIQWELRRFTGLTTRADDETMVVLKVKP